MNPIDLVEWRRKFALSQEQLAKLLGKTRKTIVNWERGHTRMPKGFENTLSDLVPHLAKAPEKPAHTHVTPASAPHLYGPPIRRDGQTSHARLPEHPRNLLPHLFPDVVDETTGQTKLAPIPLEVLQSPVYLDARAVRRAIHGTAGIPENVTPEQLAAIGEARRLARLTPEAQIEADYCKRHGIPWEHWLNVPQEQREHLLAFDARKKNST